MKDKDAKLLEEAYGEVGMWNYTRDIVTDVDHRIQEAKRLLNSDDDIQGTINVLEGIYNNINTFLMQHR